MILKAQPADAPVMADICAQNSFAAAWSAADFLSGINSAGSHIFKLQEEGRLIGFICYSGAAGFYELVNFAVAQDFLRRGFGRRLLAETLKQLALQGAKEVTLEVNTNNDIAITLYKTVGFKQAAIREKFYNNAADALIMKIDL